MMHKHCTTPGSLSEDVLLSEVSQKGVLFVMHGS